MYKVFQSFWSSKSNSSGIDERKNVIHPKKDDDWVMISKTIDEDNRTENANPLEISWIKSDEQQIPLARFNPIENLLIEHASEYRNEKENRITSSLAYRYECIRRYCIEESFG